MGRGGRERRGGERKKGGGGEGATRQSCDCACADLARCPGVGESGQLGDLELWPEVREWGSRDVVAGLGPGASPPVTRPFSPSLQIAERTRSDWAVGEESGAASF